MNEDLMEALGLQHDNSGAVSATRIDSAAKKIDSMTKIGDEIVGANSASKVIYTKTGENAFSDSQWNSTLTARELAYAMAFFGNQNMKYKLNKK